MMTAEEIVRALRNMLPEPVDYAELVGSPVPSSYGHHFVYEDPEPYIIEEAADLIESMQSQLADYHHMSGLVDGKMEENQRLRRINENLQEQLAESQRREQAAVEDARQGSVCRTCHYLNNGCEPLNLDAGCHKWKWRGPQETWE